MLRNVWHRWLRGLGLSFWITMLLGVTWGIPVTLLDHIGERWHVPLIPALLCDAAVLVCCPLAFEWLTRTFGITMETNVPRDGGTVSGGC